MTKQCGKEFRKQRVNYFTQFYGSAPKEIQGLWDVFVCDKDEGHESPCETAEQVMQRLGDEAPCFDIDRARYGG